MKKSLETILWPQDNWGVVVNEDNVVKLLLWIFVVSFFSVVVVNSFCGVVVSIVSVSKFVIPYSQLLLRGVLKSPLGLNKMQLSLFFRLNFGNTLSDV